MGTKQFGPFEACGQYVRTKRNADGSGGFLVAEIPVAFGNAGAIAQLFAAAPRMAEALQRAARILAELPPEQQDARMIALRNEIVGCVKAATPDYYGLAMTSGEFQ